MYPECLVGQSRPSPDQDISDFLLRACHDVRSPVRAIRAHAELMANPAAGDGRQNLDFILNGARTLELLAEGMAAYANALRIEPHSFQTVPMDVMLRTAVARLDKEIRQGGATVTAGDLPTIFGDAGLLVQVFEQLLRNAIRHSGRNPPHIRVAAQKEGADWIFAVEDDGDGIENLYLERIFRPFERLNRSSDGAGLGLAICRLVVEGHGGRIWAESGAGNGATFRFTLPVAEQ